MELLIRSCIYLVDYIYLVDKNKYFNLIKGGLTVESK